MKVKKEIKGEVLTIDEFKRKAQAVKYEDIKVIQEVTVTDPGENNRVGGMHQWLQIGEEFFRWYFSQGEKQNIIQFKNLEHFEADLEEKGHWINMAQVQKVRWPL